MKIEKGMTAHTPWGQTGTVVEVAPGSHPARDIKVEIPSPDGIAATAVQTWPANQLQFEAPETQP